jgi:hypothetical protein
VGLPSLATGCFLTYKILSRFGRNELKWTFEIHYPGDPNLPPALSHQIRFDMLHEIFQTKSDSTVESWQSPDVFEQINHEVGASTDSYSCSKLARTWLSDCQNNHPECKSYSGLLPVLPKRVIDVDKSGEPQSAFTLPVNYRNTVTTCL